MSKNDIFINGTGSCGGGVFDTARINGAGKFTSNVECDDFNCNGTGKVHGDLIAKEAEIKGTCGFSGNVSANELEVDGAVKIARNVNVSKMNVNGSIVIGADLSSENIRVDGECKVSGNVESICLNLQGILKAENCECEKFTGTGKVNINGLLTAEEIDLKLFWNSTIHEVGGHKVKIEPAEKMVMKLIAKFIKPKLKVDVIEADEVSITYTKAKIVRGANVWLGDGCEVDLIEYTEIFTPGANAKYGKAVKV